MNGDIIFHFRLIVFYPDVCNDCPDDLDLVFLLDSSGSIQFMDDKNWRRMLGFVASTVSRLNVERVNVGVMTFSHDVRTDIRLGQYNNRDDLSLAIHSIQYHGDEAGTDLALGLGTLVKEMFGGFHEKEEEEVVGIGRQRLVVVVSDGQETLNLTDVNNTAQQIKQMGIGK